MQPRASTAVAQRAALALAERAAQLLLCEGKPKPCGACDGCRWFLSGNHPDFRRVEPEALAKVPPADPDDEAPAAKRTKQPSIEIKVDQVRELADFLYVRSHRGALRVALESEGVRNVKDPIVHE